MRDLLSIASLPLLAGSGVRHRWPTSSELRGGPAFHQHVAKQRRWFYQRIRAWRQMRS